LRWLDDARALPRGARFYRCALQVNPFEYQGRYGNVTPYQSENEYNGALIEACKASDVEVIAVTDHYEIRTGQRLIAEAEKAGIAAFPGFEAVSKDGVHLLCVFERGSSLDAVDRAIGACGIIARTAASPVGDLDALELLEKSEQWGALCIAAHVAGPGGLLKQLSGQSRIRAWRSEYLHAVALPGPVSDAPTDLRPILENRNPDYERHHPPAVVNATDVSAPEDFAQARAWCEVKMSEISLAGLRHAFLDPQSRVRITGDPEPLERTELVAIRWDGGFLDGITLPLNDNLNVLVGGRGAGKSTLVESVRYVLELEPAGESAAREHAGIVRNVLRSGTRIALLVRSHRPSRAEYVVERTVPNPPVVRDAVTGRVLDLRPSDVAPRTEVYGQHEISEIARSPDRRTRVLERFVEHNPDLADRKKGVTRALADSRRRLLDGERDLLGVTERLEALPGLEETLKRYKSAGVEERLAERSVLVREEALLRSAEERLDPFETLGRDLRTELPLDRTFVSEGALAELPGADTLRALDGILSGLDVDLDETAQRLEAAITRARSGIHDVRKRWDIRREKVENAYQRILRDLQKDHVDGAEFIRLRQQIEVLRPLHDQRAALQRSLDALRERRRALLVEWEDLKAQEFRGLERAAKKVTRRLRGRVNVGVRHAADRESLLALLRNHVGGRLKEACDQLEQRPQLSLTELAEAMRAGPIELQQRFGIGGAAAQRLAEASPETIMLIEELDLPSLTEVELNVARDGDDEHWQPLDALSTGQKATAILLLLLLESDAPLVVDQPEDDLDNRFIAEGIVPRMREEKRMRQFVFSTHNANIPVLGDAELIVGLSATGDQSEVASGHLGSIDMKSVRDLVEELLEGGHDAFEQRRRIYGY